MKIFGVLHPISYHITVNYLFIYCHCLSRYAHFTNKTVGIFIASHRIENVPVKSEAECAHRCLRNSFCTAISVDCMSLKTNGLGTCYLRYAETPTNPYVMTSQSDVCTMKAKTRFPEVQDYSSPNLQITQVTQEASTKLDYSSASLQVTQEASTKLDYSSASLQVTQEASTKLDYSSASLQVTQEASTNLDYSSASLQVTQEASTKLDYSSASLQVTQVTQVATISQSNMSYIIDVSNNFIKHCGPLSHYDIGIITTDKVFFYDDQTSLGSPPCDVRDVTSYFSGFSGLPDPREWDSVMTVQRSNIDVYSNGNVWRWVFGDKRLWADGHFPKSMTDTLHFTLAFRPSFIPSGNLIWSVYCSRLASVNMYYYDDTGTFYVYRLQTPQESAFHTGTSLVDQSGVSLNHWSQLPSNVIGVAFYDEEDFVIVTSDFNFHILDLDYTVPTGAPREELTSMGPIAFS